MFTHSDDSTPEHEPEPDDRVREMIEEFRVAKQRRLVRLGMTLWDRTEAEHARKQLRPVRADDHP